MFARYYNSATGRFLSPDWSAKVEPVPYAKLGDPQSLNLYSYVRNSPVALLDLDGHEAESDMDRALNELDALEKQADNWAASITQQEHAAYDPSKSGPEDPTNPGHPLHKNPKVKKAAETAWFATNDGSAGNGRAEGGFVIAVRNGSISTEQQKDSTHEAIKTELSFDTDDPAIIAVYHTHGNAEPSTPSLPGNAGNGPGDTASRLPNYVRSASHLYVTRPHTNSWTDLGTP
jgi:RHS repeat-associated protein